MATRTMRRTNAMLAMLSNRAGDALWALAKH